MKEYTLFLLFFIFSGIRAQQNIFPDTLPGYPDVAFIIIKRDCLGCNPVRNNELLYKYVYNEFGKNYIIQGLDSLGNAEGRVLFEYSKNKIISYSNYNTFSFSSNDSDESVWDSNSISNKIIYNYTNGNLSKIANYDDGDRLSFDITFFYDDKQNILSEVYTEYSYSNIFEFNAFKPNSVELLDSIRIIGNSINKKIYKYIDNKRIIRYYRDNRYTGKEIQTYDNSKNIISRVLLNSVSDTLLIENNDYNLRNELIEKEIFETGYDGYGDSYDFSGFNRHTYEYDKIGRLQRENLYYKNNIFIVEKYEYHLK